MQNYSMLLPHYSIGAEIYNNIPKFCLPHGTKIVAIYGIAIQLQQMYMSFSTAISGVLLPKITSMVSVSGNEKAVSELFIKTGRLQFIIMSFVLCGFTLFGRQFIELWDVWG